MDSVPYTYWWPSRSLPLDIGGNKAGPGSGFEGRLDSCFLMPAPTKLTWMCLCAPLWVYWAHGKH